MVYQLRSVRGNKGGNVPFALSGGKAWALPAYRMSHAISSPQPQATAHINIAAFMAAQHVK